MGLLVTGASGQLGGYVLRELAKSSLRVVAWSGARVGSWFGCDVEPVDLADSDRVASAFGQARPTLVIHAGALAAVGECWHDPERARKVNAQGTATLAELAARAGARFLLVSTDLVFDGSRGSYREQDPPSPLSVYGRTKSEAETTVLSSPRNVVARLSLLFGPTVVGRPYFFNEQVQSLRTGKPVTLFKDEWRTPLSLATAARALVRIVHSDYECLLHVGGPERMSRLEMGQRLARYFGADPSAIVAAERDSIPTAEPRPRDTSLDSSRWRELFPDVPWYNWEASLKEMDIR